MANYAYTPPKIISGKYFFGSTAASLDRLRTLLILTGHGEITDISNSNPIKLKHDFMMVPIGTAMPFKLDTITSKIPGCTKTQFKKLIQNAATKNFGVHENLYREVMHCVAHYEKGSYIASFVHIYRLIEHAALYLPLVSVIAKGVNNNTFSEYKAVIDNKAKSDLSVLKKFSQTILDNSFSATIARYSFSSTTSPAPYCHIIRTLIDPKDISTSGPDYIDIKYGATDRLIIEFRNQFFHYIYHEKNITLADLKDPDDFLRICLPHFITYFSFLYRELLIAEWELWAK